MTPSLGDAFPQNFRETFSNDKIKPGAVFRMYVEDTDPPKIKRFIILAINDDVSTVALFYINSEINPTMFQTEAMRKLHMPLDKSRFPFLDHDSFLDCSHLYERSINTLKNEFTHNLNIHLGQIGNIELEVIRKIASSSHTIERKLKKRYNLSN